MSDQLHALERREIIIHTRMIRAAIYAARGLRCEHDAKNDDIAQFFRPIENSSIEFWCHGMTRAVAKDSGIRGWFRGGLFWSHDDADSYSPAEVAHWISIRTPMQCIARGCDGCLVCKPLARHGALIDDPDDTGSGAHD